jgi:hypothetical protein
MSADLYRMRALGCRDNAKATVDPTKRANWLLLAAQWQELATEVEIRQLRLGACANLITSETRGFKRSAFPPGLSVHICRATGGL